jgi:hypothetical protein
MNSMENRVRNAMGAIASTVREVRPFDLPPAPAPRARGARGAWRGRSKTWITPLAAAAAVLAVAVALVIVRSVPNGRAVPASRSPISSSVSSPVLSWRALSPPSNIPQYYVALSNPPDSSAPYQAVVSGTFTGTRLATVDPPAHTTFAGVTAAADGRNFVLDATSCTRPIASSGTCPRTWYLLRFASSSAVSPRQLTRLPIPATASGTQVQAIALSPDGSELAVALQPDALRRGAAPESLTVYSVATGAVLRTWSGPSGTILNPVQWPRVDSNIPISWLDDGHTLAFSNVSTLRLLEVTRPGHDLIADSRIVWSYPGSGQPRGYHLYCEGSTADTAGGETLVCGATGIPSDTRSVPSKCSAMWDNAMGFLEYSAATGKLTRALYVDQTTCTSEVTADVLWASPFGGTLIGLLNSAPISDPGGPQRNQVGVVTQGRFTPIPFRLPIGVAASNEVAW